MLGPGSTLSCEDLQQDGNPEATQFSLDLEPRYIETTPAKAGSDSEVRKHQGQVGATRSLRRKRWQSAEREVGPGTGPREQSVRLGVRSLRSSVPPVPALGVRHSVDP